MLWFDIETDGLKPTEIFCVGCIVDNQEAVIIKEPEDFRVLLSNLKDKHIVGHNSIAFDVPVLERLWKIDFSNYSVLCCSHTEHQRWKNIAYRTLGLLRQHIMNLLKSYGFFLMSLFL